MQKNLKNLQKTSRTNKFSEFTKIIVFYTIALKTLKMKLKDSSTQNSIKRNKILSNTEKKYKIRILKIQNIIERN